MWFLGVGQERTSTHQPWRILSVLVALGRTPGSVSLSLPAHGGNAIYKRLLELFAMVTPSFASV